jgi:hypothetical protein
MVKLGSGLTWSYPTIWHNVPRFISFCAKKNEIIAFEGSIILPAVRRPHRRIPSRRSFSHPIIPSRYRHRPTSNDCPSLHVQSGRMGDAGPAMAPLSCPLLSCQIESGHRGPCKLPGPAMSAMPRKRGRAVKMMPVDDGQHRTWSGWGQRRATSASRAAK